MTRWVLPPVGPAPYRPPTNTCCANGAASNDDPDSPIRCSEGHRCWQWRSLYCEKPRLSLEFPSRAAVKALLMALLNRGRGLMLVLSNAMTSLRASQTAATAPVVFSNTARTASTICQASTGEARLSSSSSLRLGFGRPRPSVSSPTRAQEPKTWMRTSTPFSTSWGDACG